MTELRALIFDVDGTLAETERDAHRPAFNRAFADAGLDWNWSVEFYGKLLEVAGGKERIRHYIEQYQSNFPLPDDLDGFVAELHAAKMRHFRQLVGDRIAPRKGVRRLLQEAREQGMGLAIATTSAQENVEALLKRAIAPESLSWFDAIGAGDMVAEKKPAPDIYHYVLETLNLRPEECLAIEDSHQGLLAARSADLTTIITLNDYTRNQDFSAAALVLDSLGEPDAPFTVLAGNAGDATYFDLALARQLHRGV